jgi:para-nitrobenzyl esterase
MNDAIAEMGASRPVSVTVAEGILEGRNSVDGAVNIFKGIPYAIPPIGQRRWRPPEPAAPWHGVRSAHEFGSAPIQPRRPPNSLTFLGHEQTDEDCLYLNIWAPSATDERHPVIVWFHFGAYLMGSGAGFLWDGEELAKLGAVVVTVNFRLGRFGFLAHPQLSAESIQKTSGNYGLLDQIAALKWVQANIEAFNGDPHCVTVMGQSSGAASVSLLMASPLAVGLFHRAIGQSGGAFETPRPNAGWPALSPLEDAERNGVELMRSLDCDTIDALRNEPADRILNALTEESPVNWRKGLFNPAFICGYPVADGYVIPRSGIGSSFHKRSFNDVPLLVGITANEGGGKAGARNVSEHVAEAQRYGNLADEYLNSYPAFDDLSAQSASSRAIGDQLFGWEILTWARLHAQNSARPCFVYKFERVPAYPKDISLAETDGDASTDLGAIHGAEIPYVFMNLRKRNWPWSKDDVALSKLMANYWLQFAKHGDPNHLGSPHWPVFSKQKPLAMILGDQVKTGAISEQQRLQFWDLWFELIL